MTKFQLEPDYVAAFHMSPAFPGGRSYSCQLFGNLIVPTPFVPIAPFHERSKSITFSFVLRGPLRPGAAALRALLPPPSSVAPWEWAPESPLGALAMEPLGTRLCNFREPSYVTFGSPASYLPWALLPPCTGLYGSPSSSYPCIRYSCQFCISPNHPRCCVGVCSLARVFFLPSPPPPAPPSPLFSLRPSLPPYSFNFIALASFSASPGSGFPFSRIFLLFPPPFSCVSPLPAL